MRKFWNVWPESLGYGYIVLGWLLAWALVLTGCKRSEPPIKGIAGQLSYEHLRIDGSCFVVFRVGYSEGIAAAMYPCPVAREELVRDEAL